MRIPMLTKKRPEVANEPEAYWFYPALGAAVIIVVLGVLTFFLSVGAVVWRSM